jgi:hypothetical protein
MTALYVCSQVAQEKKVSILADGGITKSGDIVKALTLAQGVICGGMFAGCTEAPGEVVEIGGSPTIRCFLRREGDVLVVATDVPHAVLGFGTPDARDAVEITRLFKTFEKVRTASRRHMDTGPLNRLIQTATTGHPAPTRHGKRFKILYATNPKPETKDVVPVPEIVMFCNEGRLLEDSYRRYLEGRIRNLT